MRFFISTAALLLTSWLGGCVTPPALLTPPTNALTANGANITRSAELDKEAAEPIYSRFVNSKRDVLYYQNFGGGGVALGVLLGPLGAMANIGMIKSATEADATLLQDRIQLDPAALFRQATRQADAALFPPSSSSRATTISPYLYLSKTDNDVILIASALLVEHGGDARPWKGKYLYQLPLTYTLAQLQALDGAQIAALSESAVNGYAHLVRFLKQETLEKASAEPKILFRSDLVTPRIQIEQAGTLAAETSSHQWVRGPGAVYALRKDHVQVQRLAK